MHIEPAYKTNEVLGSFWRPDDYMAHAPAEHVTGKNPKNSSLSNNNLISLDISDAGMQLAKQYGTNALDQITAPSNAPSSTSPLSSPDFLFSSVDGSVRFINYAI